MMMDLNDANGSDWINLQILGSGSLSRETVMIKLSLTVEVLWKRISILNFSLIDCTVSWVAVAVIAR